VEEKELELKLVLQVVLAVAVLLVEEAVIQIMEMVQLIKVMMEK
jgi:hypothetical protein